MMKTILKELLDNFEKYLREDEKQEATIQKYIHDIQCFVSYMEERERKERIEDEKIREIENVEKIEKSFILAYKEMLGEKYAISSANSMIAALNSFFRFAGWMELCVRQFKVQRKTYCAEEKELTREEYKRLVETAQKKGNERLALIIQTICATGIRVSELQYITVEAVEKGEAVVSCKGKTRTVFIVLALRKKLLKYVKTQKIESGAIFVTKKGKVINRSNIWKAMKALCEEAGVSKEKVFPHNLRHLFARIFYGIEKDIAKLADILGHTSINTTRIYIMTTGVEHRKKMEGMRLVE